MSERVSHRQLLKHKQVMAAAVAAQSRALPSTWWYSVGVMLGLCLAIWLGGILSFWLVQRLPFAWMFAIGVALTTVIPAFLGLLAVALSATLYHAVSRRAYLRHLERLDVPLEIEATYEILPEGFRLTTNRIEIFPRWESVDTVERGNDGWIVSADQLTFLITYASFDSELEQRSFIAAFVAHMTEDARKRSGDAMAFARDGRTEPS